MLNLRAFSKTGGIEKVSSVLSKAFYDLSVQERNRFNNLSLYDETTDMRYCPKSSYKAFRGNKIRFIAESIRTGRKADVVVLTHINLALVGLLIKLLNPGVKLFVFAHGIEVWGKLSFWKRMFVRNAYKIIAVSEFTRQRLAEKFPQQERKIQVLNNCLDPFFSIPQDFNKPRHLVQNYQLAAEEKVILTVCRLATSEKYKGYDMVISALAELPSEWEWRYFIAGQYDAAEQARIRNLLKAHHLEDKVILTGFLSEEELADFFQLGDVFVMPSAKEGFGIVFIEAAACGLPLIAGNRDGSVDALMNGKLGKLIDPFSKNQLLEALKKQLNADFSKSLQQQTCLGAFNYEKYTHMLKHLICE